MTERQKLIQQKTDELAELLKDEWIEVEQLTKADNVPDTLVTGILVISHFDNKQKKIEACAVIGGSESHFDHMVNSLDESFKHKLHDLVCPVQKVSLDEVHDMLREKIDNLRQRAQN